MIADRRIANRLIGEATNPQVVQSSVPEFRFQRKLSREYNQPIFGTKYEVMEMYHSSLFGSTYLKIDLRFHKEWRHFRHSSSTKVKHIYDIMLESKCT